MTIFNERFINLFIEKHGRNVYEEIKENIINEAGTCITEDYIAKIFDVAYANYIGIHESRVEEFIKDILGQEKITYSEIKKISLIHTKTIRIIVKYISDTEKEFK